MADDETGAGETAAQLLLRQEAGRLQVTRQDGGVADLGEARQSQCARPIGGSHELVEPTHEGADADQDQSSTPWLKVARGNAASFSGHWTMKRSLKR